MSEGVTQVTDNNFEEEVLKSKLLVMVDFWAEWCPPCKMIDPIVDELARDYKGKLKVVNLNVDNGAGTATEFGVMNIPTIIFFKDGKEYKRIVGANPKVVLEKVIKEAIGG